MFKVPNISAGVGISAEGDVGDDPKARKEQLFLNGGDTTSENFIYFIQNLKYFNTSDLGKILFLPMLMNTNEYLS